MCEVTLYPASHPDPCHSSHAPAQVSPRHARVGRRAPPPQPARKFRVSDFGFRVSGFGLPSSFFCVSGFGFRGLGFRFQVLGSRFRVSVQCFKVPLRISARTEARAIDGTTQTVCSRALFEISVGCNDVIALQGMSYTSSRGSHKRPYVGVSQVRSWSHWFVLGAILWAFIAKN